jgi:hypothetical protein
MDTSVKLASAKKLLHGLCTNAPREERLNGVTVPLSALIEVIELSLEGDFFFPANKRPEDLGDGAVIERLGKHHFRVHERFEIGQLCFTKIKSSRRYFFLRSAIIRYLGHYQHLLKHDAITIERRA